MTVTLLAVIGVVLHVPSAFVPLTWHTASVLSVFSTVSIFGRLHDLLDRALGALLQRELAAVGVADVDDADRHQGEHRRDQRQLDHGGAALDPRAAS